MEKNFYISKSNFTGGEWSPEMRGRFDLPQYESALETMENFLPLPQGGSKVRPGTRIVAPAKFSTGNTVLMDLEFNSDQAYLLEFGHLYVRFYTGTGRIESSPVTITNITDTSGTIVVTAAGHGLSNGNHVAIRSVLGTYEANGDWEVSNVSGDTFRLVGSTLVNLYNTGGTVSKITELVTPYDEEDLFELKSGGEADTLYLFHPSYATQKLVRTSATTFTIAPVDWTIIPFGDTNVTATTLQPQGTTVGSSITLNASTSFFTVNSVGNYYRVANGVVKVTAVTNSTHSTATIKKATVNSATTNWAEGVWGIEQGYPIDGEFYENRLVICGSPDHPLGLWGSKYSPEYENFDPGTALASDSFAYDLRARRASIARWIVGDDLLFVGTSGREFKVSGSENSAITPTSISARPQSAHGALDIEPVVTTAGVVFAQRTGTKLRVIKYSLDADKYVAPDLTLLDARAVSAGITQLTYEAEPNELVYAVLSDGTYSTLTLLSDQNVQAWSRHNTTGTVLSAKTIKTTGQDRTWIAVRRNINGTDRVYIEYLDPTIALDAAVVGTFAAPGVTTITTGLEYLEGEEVTIVGDNAVYPSQTVTGNALPTALDLPVQSVVIGLPFSPYMKFLPPGRELPDGFIAGRRFKILRVKLLVKDTRGLSVNGDLNYTRSTADNMDEAPPAGSEYIEFTPNLDWDESLEIRQTLPYPAHILSATLYVAIGD